MSRKLRLTPALAAGCALAVLVVSGALSWFQPWRLLTDTTVTEELSAVTAPASPGATSPVVPGPSGATSPVVPGPSGAASPVVPGPRVLAEGSFVTHEHRTTGVARLVRAADGTHRLELAGLATSDGPDLRVWLSDQPVRTGTAGWKVFDDGSYVELGRLKGNRGDQVYRIGTEVDPGAFRSVSIWCKRFSVSFGAAALTPPAAAG